MGVGDSELKAFPAPAERVGSRPRTRMAVHCHLYPRFGELAFSSEPSGPLRAPTGDKLTLGDTQAHKILDIFKDRNYTTSSSLFAFFAQFQHLTVLRFPF